MAFSAVVGKSVRLADGQIQTHVTVTNDANGNTFEDDLSYQPGSDLASTQKNLEARVRAAIDLAKRIAQAKGVALLPVGTVLDLTVPVAPAPPPPTADQIARREFSIAYQQYLRLQRAQGIVTDKAIADALAEAQRLYDPSFEDVLL